MVICLQRGADLHMVQLTPLPLTVSCFSKIQIGFTFLVLAHPGSPRQKADKRAFVYYMEEWTTAGISFHGVIIIPIKYKVAVLFSYPKTRSMLLGI